MSQFSIFDFPFSFPAVMGILNITPDSFFDGGQYTTIENAVLQAEKMLNSGAAILDIGAMSSRPNARIISPEEEIERLLPILKRLVLEFPCAVISIDTLHSKTAEISLKNGAKIINDITGGNYDKEMLSVVAKLNAIFIAMHTRGTPETMQSLTDYNDVVHEVYEDLRLKIERCKQVGIKNIIADVGFGFAKTTEQNFQLLKQLSEFKKLGVPILAGISRKSMITKTLGINSAEALNGTSVLNTIALLNGVNILRVHDVREAVECVKLTEAVKNGMAGK